MSGTGIKYQKSRDIEIATVSNIPDSNIDLPPWKWYCCCFQDFLPLSLPDEDTISF